jgi:hypothetical protein
VLKNISCPHHLPVRPSHRAGGGGGGGGEEQDEEEDEKEDEDEGKDDEKGEDEDDKEVRMTRARQTRTRRARTKRTRRARTKRTRRTTEGYGGRRRTAEDDRGLRRTTEDGGRQRWTTEDNEGRWRTTEDGGRDADDCGRRRTTAEADGRRRASEAILAQCYGFSVPLPAPVAPMAPRAERLPLLLTIRHGEVFAHVHDAGLAAQHIQAVSPATLSRPAGRDPIADIRHGLADACELLTALLFDALGKPCAGLQQAARSARNHGLLDRKLAMRLCRLGEAAAEVRNCKDTAMAIVIQSTQVAVTAARRGRPPSDPATRATLDHHRRQERRPVTDGKRGDQ